MLLKLLLDPDSPLLAANSDPQADLDLARRTLAGEPTARAEFVERMRLVSRVLAARNARSGRPFAEGDLEDLAQDVLVIVWRKLSTFAGESPLEAWVYTICAYEFLNALRRRSTRTSRVVAMTEETPEPEAREEPPEDPNEFDSLLKHLAPREAEVVRLRHVDGMNLREVSEVLGISSSSTKTHYYRGLEKIRRVVRVPSEEAGA